MPAPSHVRRKRKPDIPGKPPGKRKVGRKPRISDRALVDSLIDLMEEGMLARPACQIVGLHEATLYRWLERGEYEQNRQELELTPAQRREQDEPSEQDEEPYREFRERFLRARASFEREAVQTIRKVIQGGELIEETVRTLRDGSTEETKRWTTPDAKAAFTYLQHARGGEWAKRQEIEVSASGLPVGASGASAGAAGSVEVQEVRERVLSNIARAREQVAITAGDPADAGEVVDAELVTEGENLPSRDVTGE